MSTCPSAAISARGHSVAVILQAQILEFPACQRPPMPARQVAEPKLSDSNAKKTFGAISDGFKHAPNLSIYSLPQGNAKTLRRERVKPRNFRALAIKKNSTQELWSEGRIPGSIQRNRVLLINFKARMGELLRQFTIVRQKQQTFSLGV
jgi:hypothetical protein